MPTMSEINNAAKALAERRHRFIDVHAPDMMAALVTAGGEGIIASLNTVTLGELATASTLLASTLFHEIEKWRPK